MHLLYPPIKPYLCQEFTVDEPHVLYLEESGNPNGLPVIVLHSGPGAGGDTNLRRFFDPDYYRIIIFDQRGCGRSTPHAHVDKNTTQDLLNDIDAIRKHLNLDQVILFGGAWGAALALLYAETYPQHVQALLLHQINLCRQEDIDWFYKEGTNKIFPDYWQEFTNQIPVNNIQDIPGYYSHCLRGSNEVKRMAAAKNWALWHAHCGSLQPHANLIEYYSDPHLALALATIESHYINHHYFITEDQILKNAPKIRHIPCHLIHGRYDMITPLAGACALQALIPTSNLFIIRDAGHSEREAGMIDAIIQASKEILKF